MADFSVPLSKAAAQFEALGQDMKKAAFRGLILAGSRGLQKLITQIIPSRVPTPVDRGLYRAGWKLRVGNDFVEIYNDEPHADFIEEGVRAKNVKPGKAMLEAIAAWVRRKGLANNPAEVLSISWAIVRSMQKKGIFNRRGPYANGLGILRELVDHYLDDLIETEVLANIGKI